jgi:hypothetical protein
VSRYRHPVEFERKFWQLVRAGLLTADAAVGAGVSATAGRRWFRTRGGVIPSIVAEPKGRGLSLAEREEIACLRAEGLGVRAIARRLGTRPRSAGSCGGARPRRPDAGGATRIGPRGRRPTPT